MKWLIASLENLASQSEALSVELPENVSLRALSVSLSQLLVQARAALSQDANSSERSETGNRFTIDG